MSKNSSVNLDITNNADGFDISGGTTARKATFTGADITLTGSGSNTMTFPSSAQTLVGLTSTDTLTNKTLTSQTLSAGTAAAGTAPIKLTSGTNLGTPEAGTIEFDGTYFYITI